MTFSITSIPAIMRKQGWLNGAKFLERWFAGAPATAPAYGPPDTQTIRMSTWVLSYPRARAVYDQLMRERIWMNAAAQKEIAAMLRKKGLLALVPQCRPFGNLAAPVYTLDNDYINYRIVSFTLGDLDDLSAALGNFSFRVVVAGTITPDLKTHKCSIMISEVGVYVRDSFDFNGSQFLGFWDDKDMTVSMINPLAGTSVSNDDFRSWRTKNHKGGDFLVYSDLLKTRLTKPDVFEI
jgi:Family of unknown function (DUF6402)